jgi:hypothetical protein
MCHAQASGLVLVAFQGSRLLKLKLPPPVSIYALISETHFSLTFTSIIGSNRLIARIQIIGKLVSEKCQGTLLDTTATASQLSLSRH